MNQRTFEDALRERFDAALGDGPAHIREVARIAMEAEPEAFSAKSAQLIENAAVRWLKDYARHLEGQSLSVPLPGFEMPGVIAVRREGGEVEHWRTDMARWGELEAGRAERVQNVLAAQDKLDAYDRTLDVLRPVMQANPFITVRDALKRLFNKATQ